MKNIRNEILADIFEEHGVKATDEQIKNISDDFSMHLESEKEMESYAHININPSCDRCNELEKQLKNEKADSIAYYKFIKKIKNARSVWVNNGIVEWIYR